MLSSWYRNVEGSATTVDGLSARMMVVDLRGIEKFDWSLKNTSQKNTGSSVDYLNKGMNEVKSQIIHSIENQYR